MLRRAPSQSGARRRTTVRRVQLPQRFVLRYGGRVAPPPTARRHDLHRIGLCRPQAHERDGERIIPTSLHRRDGGKERLHRHCRREPRTRDDLYRPVGVLDGWAEVLGAVATVRAESGRRRIDRADPGEGDCDGDRRSRPSRRVPRPGDDRFGVRPIQDLRASASRARFACDLRRRGARRWPAPTRAVRGSDARRVVARSPAPGCRDVPPDPDDGTGALQRGGDAARKRLTAGVYRSPDKAPWFFDDVEAGVPYANRPQGATAGAWPGYQPFGGWNGSGSTGKSIASFYYVAQCRREQSQTIVE